MNADLFSVTVCFIDDHIQSKPVVAVHALAAQELLTPEDASRVVSSMATLVRKNFRVVPENFWAEAL